MAKLFLSPGDNQIAEQVAGSASKMLAGQTKDSYPDVKGPQVVIYRHLFPDIKDNRWRILQANRKTYLAKLAGPQIVPDTLVPEQVASQSESCPLQVPTQDTPDCTKIYARQPGFSSLTQFVRAAVECCGDSLNTVSPGRIDLA